jgi:hypothetical protein
VSSHQVVSSGGSASCRVASSIFIVLTLGLLLLAPGCGSSGTFVPVKGPFGTGSLKGAYTYTLYGLDTTGAFFSEAGVFTADGNGKITSGTDDFNQNGTFASNPINGTYSVLPDGSGLITFMLTNVAPPNNTFQFAINLVSSTQLYLAENDAFANGAGMADSQAASAITATPSGTFALRVHAYQTLNGPVGTIGQVLSNAGVVQGSAEILRSGTLSAATLTGQFSAPDATGRGQFRYTDSVTNISTNYQYYIINSTTIRLLGTDGSVLSQGRLEAQSGAPFSAASLSGSYAFGSVGNLTSNDGGAARTVGTFTASGGSVSTGAFDAVVSGTVLSNNTVESGAYSVNANGEVLLTLNPSGGAPVQEIQWLVSPSRAFMLVNDPTKVEDGTVDLEQSSSFSNSSLSQQSAIFMEGLVINTNYLTRVGTFIPNGNGGVTLNEVANAFTPTLGAILNTPSLPGSYTVGSNGRVTGTFNASPSPNIDFVMYLLAPNKGYILQNDTGVQVSGQVTLQTSP